MASKTSSSKIPRFSSKKAPSASQLKEFRNYVSQLKRKGLIPKGTSARSARPAFVRGGKTLAEIVNKNSDKLTPYQTKVSAPQSKLLPPRKPVSIRALPHTHKSFGGLIKDLRSNAAEINAMKKPDEFFGFRVKGTDSYYLFPNIDLLANRLEGNYPGADPIGKRYRKIQEDIVENLSIIRWNRDPGQWGPQRKISRTKSGIEAAKKRRR